MKNLERALMVATKAHATQTYDIYPYDYHLRQVVSIAQELGYDETIQVACALHDCLEDTELSYNDIKKAFGKDVAEIVFCVTDELGRNRKERKEKTYPKIRSNWRAIVVKICDRIANMRQSKEYNPTLFKMYEKELETFAVELRNGAQARLMFNEIEKAWECLYSLKTTIAK